MEIVHGAFRKCNPNGELLLWQFFYYFYLSSLNDVCWVSLTQFVCYLALFLIRDGDFATKLPENLKDAFVDEDEFAQRKLVKLKQVICEQFPVRIYFFFERKLAVFELQIVLTEYLKVSYGFLLL